MAPLAPCEPGQVTTPNSHSSEQGTLPTVSLIIKQAVSYRTHGDTYCPGRSTLKTRSLADLIMTNHKPWTSQPFPPFQTLFKPQHRISPWSPHHGKHIGTKWSRVTCLALPLAAAQRLGSQVLEDSQSRWRLSIVTKNMHLQTNK
jgi:hypothetical protein